MITISDSDSDSDSKALPITSDAMKPEPIYEVESIVGHRLSQVNENLMEYKIKWKGYADKYNTWENEKNVYSKGLIQEYWKKQPYTLSEFKNTAAQSSKKPVIQKTDRKQLEKEIREATLSATPPSGLVWSDMEAVVNVFYRDPNVYFAEIKWTNHSRNTYIPTRIIKKFNPMKLLEFYEKNLEYYIPHAASS